ncbi:MAG: hypothetical protein KW806_02235 [Candidatus Yanofskybacteria bacterium]|nr:hypothetical protein [Candidatus Yanofskybacteria bacterium]
MVMKDRSHILNVMPFVVGAAIVITGLLWYAGQAQQAPAQSELLEGTVLAVIPASRVIVLENGDGEQVGMALGATTKLVDERDRAVELSYFRLGSRISAQGVYASKTTFIPYY